MTASIQLGYAARRGALRILSLVLASTLAACGADSTTDAPPATAAPVEVVFLSHTAESGLDAEASAALDWLRSRAEFHVTFRQLADLATPLAPSSAVLWWHHALPGALPSAALGTEALEAVRTHLSNGGAVLLSLLSAPWVVPLGVESVGPNQVAVLPGTAWARWAPDDDRILAGMQSYQGHPLLRRHWGTVLSAWMRPDTQYASAAWTDDTWPADGKVVAIGRRYIGLNPERRTVVEYDASAARSGHILAIGEGIYFADAQNPNRTQLELLVTDALAYLGGQIPPAPAGARIGSSGAVAVPVAGAATAAGEGDSLPDEAVPAATAAGANPSLDDLPGVLSSTTYWEPRGNGTRRFVPASTGELDIVADPVTLENVLAARSGLVLERENAGTSPFTQYSPRALLLGRDNGYVDELWGYPFRVLRDLRFGLVADDDSVQWLHRADAVRYTARPEGASFRYTFPDFAVDLHLAVPRDRAGLVAVLAVDPPRNLTVRAAWRADHSIMWPREATYLGDLELGFAAGAGATIWRDANGIVETWAGFGPGMVAADTGGEAWPPVSAPAQLVDDEIAPDTESTEETPLDAENDVPVSRQVSVDATFAADAPGPLIFVAASRAGDGADAQGAYLADLRDPAAVWTANSNYWAAFLAETLSIASPDPTLNEAFRWAKVGLEAFRVTTPGMGTALTAGYAPARRASEDEWAASNDFLRRPGYGWYFGRDGIWSARAADAYGGADLAEQTLRFLARYQDVDGKILHEISPGWVAHYDAADSTPLFLLGLEHHIRATGNRDLLRELWPSVRLAMTFLERTDTDGDGLIENTNVGHGWIEGGRFYGAHTTLYLAGVWTATLEAVARMAEWVADDELAQSASEQLETARSALNEGFWDPLERQFRYGKLADGGYLSHRTILPSVPALLGVADEDKVRAMIPWLGSAEITSDWGARMVAKSNPDYNPVGYHDGSVWPLFTGWTSLAAYRARQPLIAFLHAYDNLRLVRQGSLGNIPEVIHGDVFEPAGVTEHQAWSHALSVLPIVEGLMGIRPDAINGTLQIHPQLPGGWRELTVQRIRVGEDAFNVTVNRGDEASSFTIQRVAGNAPIQFDLALGLPRAALVNLDHDATTGVAIPGGESIVNRPTEKQVRVLATLTEGNGVVAFRHSPFPEAIQVLPTPAAGATSQAMRIVESRFSAGALNVRVEGLPGQRYRFAVATPWPVRNVAGPRGSVIVSAGPGRAVIETVIPGDAETYQRADLTIEFRR